MKSADTGSYNPGNPGNPAQSVVRKIPTQWSGLIRSGGNDYCFSKGQTPVTFQWIGHVGFSVLFWICTVFLGLDLSLVFLDLDSFGFLRIWTVCFS